MTSLYLLEKELDNEYEQACLLNKKCTKSLNRAAVAFAISGVLWGVVFVFSVLKLTP